MTTSEPTDACLRQALLELAARRGPAASFCPSEVARALAQDWRPLMVPLREAARALAQQGRLTISQQGEPLDPYGEWRGPIRLTQADGDF